MLGSRCFVARKKKEKSLYFIFTFHQLSSGISLNFTAHAISVPHLIDYITLSDSSAVCLAMPPRRKEPVPLFFRVSNQQSASGILLLTPVTD